MQEEINIDVDLSGVISGYCYASFSSGRKVLEETGFSLVSGEEHAYLGGTRVTKDSNFFKTGNWIKECCAWIPDYGAVLTRYSSFIEFPKIGEELHSKCHDFNLEEKLVKKALEDCVKVENPNILTEEFNKKPETRFLFGKYARDYGLKLKEMGIDSISIYAPNSGKLAFARPIFISEVHKSRLSERKLFRIICCLRTSEMDFAVRGIKRFGKNKSVIL